MSNILREHGIENKKDRYNLSKAPGSNLSDMVGQRVEVKAYLLYEDAANDTGELRKTLKIMTPDGEICGTRSKSFIEGFEEYLDFMEEEAIDSVGVEQKRSKNGRNYLVFVA